MDLSGIDISTISTGSLAMLIVVSFMRGWVVPRSTLTDWKDAAKAKDTTISEQSHQISELLEANRTTHAVVQAIPRALEQRGAGSHDTQ